MTVTYVALFNGTEQGIKNVHDTVKRHKETLAATGKAGGRVLGFWYAQGEYDMVAVSEWSDDDSANAFALAPAKS